MSHYITPRQKVFDHLDRVVAWARGHKPGPVTLEWDLSNRCPYGCRDCHFAHTHTKGPWTKDASRRLPMLHDQGGDLADAGLVQRVLMEARGCGVEGIVWTGGGEPTVHPQALEVWQAADALGYRQGLYTLGATLTLEQATYLRDRFAWVVVSLDAITPDTYAHEKRTPAANFARACRAIELLSGGHAAVGVSFLLHEKNFMQAEDMVALGRRLGATYTTLRPTIRTQPEAPNIPLGNRAWVEQALPVLDRLSTEADVEVDPDRFLQWSGWQGHPYQTCHGISLNATITPDGRMWVCPNRREYGDGHSLLGDLRTESFGAIWARHPGRLQVDVHCRAMCRLHPLNETLDAIHTPRRHTQFL